jgi:nicotinate-nucleotide adenylyltransferase
MKKTGLYFGSFNPIHVGHMAIANYLVEFSDLDQLWFVVSPQNPLKPKSSLLADYHRFELVRRAIGDSSLFLASNIEFNMPKPSYTIDSLTYLKEKYTDHEFVLIMGSDNLNSFHKWKNHENIMSNHEIYVYPRPDFSPEKFSAEIPFKLFNAPLMEISSSFIRQSIKAGKNVSFFMPASVANYVEEMHFYEK